MKHISYYILATFCAGVLFTACQQEEGIATSESGPKELTLSAESVSDRVEVTTRAKGNTFFTDKKEIKLLITPYNGGASINAVEKRYAYDESKGLFRGKDDGNRYYFQMNDDYISKLVAMWPADRKETDKPTDVNDTGQLKIPTDQRKLEEYRKADWLTADFDQNSSSTEGVMPTDAPVPLHFKRNNARLEFEVQGQHADRQDITSLILELQLKIETIEKPIATAFWAYCNKETGHAEVILPGGSQLVCSAGYMIGRIAVAEKAEYTGTVIIPEKLDITLEPNASYKVTLTPRGDYLIASITIGGFGQDEEGVGLPFQLPVADDAGIYGISNFSQLMTLSYILREYKAGTITVPESEFDKLVKAIDWKNQRYKLTADITIPAGLTWKPVAEDTELPGSSFDLNNYTITQNNSAISFFK